MYISAVGLQVKFFSRLNTGRVPNLGRISSSHSINSGRNCGSRFLSTTSINSSCNKTGDSNLDNNSQTAASANQLKTTDDDQQKSKYFFNSSDSNCRVFGMAHSNTMGNVHGGVILNWLTETGYICALRHFFSNPIDNIKNPKNVEIVLARMERVDFLKPLSIVEQGESEASLEFTSPHSMEVAVRIYGTDYLLKEKVKKCEAKLWFVPVEVEKNKQVKLYPLNVKPIEKVNNEKYQEGLTRYHSIKEHLHNNSVAIITENWKQYKLNANYNNPSLNSINSSLVSYTKLISYDMCSSNDLLAPSVILKIIDETGSNSCKRFLSGYSYVTSSLEAFDIYSPGIRNNILNVESRVIYTEKRCAVVEILAFNEDTNTNVTNLVCSSYFIYYALPKSTLTTGKNDGYLPPINITNDYDRKKYEYGKQIFENSKKVRRQQKK